LRDKDGPKEVVKADRNCSMPVIWGEKREAKHAKKEGTGMRNSREVSSRARKRSEKGIKGPIPVPTTTNIEWRTLNESRSKKWGKRPWEKPSH